MSDRRFVLIVVFVSTFLVFLLIHFSTFFYLTTKINKPRWLEEIKREIKDQKIVVHIKDLEREYDEGFNDALNCIMRENLINNNRTWGDMCDHCRKECEIESSSSRK